MDIGPLGTNHACLFFFFFFGSLLATRLKLMSGKWRFPRANRGMMGLMAMVGLTAGAWAMDFLGGGRMGFLVEVEL